MNHDHVPFAMLAFVIVFLGTGIAACLIATVIEWLNRLRARRIVSRWASQRRGDPMGEAHGDIIRVPPLSFPQ